MRAKLDAAFKELYHLSVFVGGDPADWQSSLLEGEFEALQASVVAKFEETKVEGNQAWRNLCAAHATVSFCRSDDGLIPLIGD